jgi:hypothetical protein
MFGGGRCMSEAMVPSDIVVRGNHFTKDERGSRPPSKPAVKNLFEIKNGQRWLVGGEPLREVLDGRPGGRGDSAEGGEQRRAGGARAEPQGIFRLNAVRQAGGFLTVNYSEAGVTLGTEDIEISNNVAYDLGVGSWTGDGHAFRLGGGPDAIRLLHNTVLNRDSFLKLWDQPAVKSLLGLRVVGTSAARVAMASGDRMPAGSGRWRLTPTRPATSGPRMLEDNGTASIAYPPGRS